MEVRASMEQLQSWLAEGSQRLTDRQRLYIDAYYNQGLSLERIAQEQGVNVSTVSRVIRAGMGKLEERVEAKRLIAACAESRDSFDWTRYLFQGRVLTPRQRQLALLVLSGLPRSQRELAGRLELEQSTVSRTLSAAGRTLRRLDTPRARPTARPNIRDWEGAGPQEMDLSPEAGRDPVPGRPAPPGS